MDANIRLEHDLIAVEGEHDVHAMLELVAPDVAGDSPRAPLSLALVIDRSGSMHGAKLEIAKRCASWLVGRLGAADRLALIDYDDEVRLLSPLVPVEKNTMQGAIARIHPGGQTNLSGGWLLGLEQLRAANGDGVRKILMLTDGQANVGITDRPRLVGLAQSGRGHGVGTATIGFGAGFDEDLLTQMADAGGGNAHYAETPDAAPAIFAEELDGLTKLVAQNVSAEIRPTAHVEVIGVLNDYPHAPVPTGIRVDLGDAYAGEKRRIVFGLHVPALAELGVVKVADVVVRYVSVGDEVAQHEITIPIALNLVSADEAAAAQPDLEVQEQVSILLGARARDEANLRADAGDFDSAQTLLRDAVDRLRESGQLDEAAELEQIMPSMAPQSYGPAVRKRMHFDSHRRKRGKN